MSFMNIVKLVLEHLLTIVLIRLKIKKLRFKLAQDSGINNNKSEEVIKEKVRHLKKVAYVLAFCCDRIDVLTAPSEDPRINQKM